MHQWSKSLRSRRSVLPDLPEPGAGVRRLHRPHLRLRQRRGRGHVRCGLRGDGRWDAQREKHSERSSVPSCRAAIITPVLFPFGCFSVAGRRRPDDRRAQRHSHRRDSDRHPAAGHLCRRDGVGSQGNTTENTQNPLLSSQRLINFWGPRRSARYTFDQDWNISTYFGWVKMTFGTNTHGPQRMHPTVESLKFTKGVSSKRPLQLLDKSHSTWFIRSCYPQDAFWKHWWSSSFSFDPKIKIISCFS